MIICAEIENLRRILMDARNSSSSEMMKQVETVKQKLPGVMAIHKQYANIDHNKSQKVQKYQKYLEASLSKAKTNIKNRDKSKTQKRLDKTIKALQKTKELFSCYNSASTFNFAPSSVLSSSTVSSLQSQPSKPAGCGCGGPKPPVSQPPKPVVQVQPPKPVVQVQVQSPTPVVQPQPPTPVVQAPVSQPPKPVVQPQPKPMPANVLSAAKALAAKPGGCGCGKKATPVPAQPRQPQIVTPIVEEQKIPKDKEEQETKEQETKEQQTTEQQTTEQQTTEQQTKEQQTTEQQTPEQTTEENKMVEVFKLFKVDHESIMADFNEHTMPKLLLDRNVLDQIIKSIDLTIVLDLPFLGGEHLEIHLNLDPSSNSTSSFFKIYKGKVVDKNSNMQLNISKIKDGVVTGFLALNNKRYNLLKQEQHYIFA